MNELGNQTPNDDGSFIKGTPFSVEGFTTLNYWRLHYPGIGRVTYNTIVYSFGSSLISTVVAALLAWIIHRTNVPFRHALLVLPFLGLKFPVFLKDVAWVLLAGRAGVFNSILEVLLGISGLLNVFSLPGMIWVASVGFTNVAYVTLSPAFSSIDASLEDIDD